MAYNDYGAFVYLNGDRQTDYEDVPVFGERDTDLGPGQRIYASLIRQMTSDKTEDGKQEKAFFEWPSRCHHGVMGDGKVRVAVYKTGIGMASVYVLKDEVDIAEGINVSKANGADDYEVNRFNPFELVIEDADELIALSGAEAIPYPKHYDDSDEHAAQADAWREQRQGEYHYEFDLADHHLLFEGRRYSEAIRPAYHARLTCPNGDIWDVFYDSDYGAGLSDCIPLGTGRNAKFDHIDVEKVGGGDQSAWPVSRRLSLRCRCDSIDDGLLSEQVIAVSESHLQELATSLGLETDEENGGDSNGSIADGGDDVSESRDRILYRAMIDETDERMPISTFSDYGDGNIVLPDVAIRLIQIGIDLARMGIDKVTTEHWWHASGKSDKPTYGLGGTAFEGFSYDLTSRWMVPSEVRWNKNHPLHDDSKSNDEIINDTFGAYRKVCKDADGTITIDGNDVGVEIKWPIRDAHGVPFSPLMQADGDNFSWQTIRRIGEGGEEQSEVIGCGWNDESPFILLAGGEMTDPKGWEIVIADEDETQD